MCSLARMELSRSGRADFRFWKENEWSPCLNYIVVIFVVRGRSSLPECLQRLYDFKNCSLLRDLSLKWEERGCKEIGEVHGRFAEGDDARYSMVCGLISMLEDANVFDIVVYMSRQHELEEKAEEGTAQHDVNYQIIRLLWGTEYTRERASIMVNSAMNDRQRMGLSWDIDVRDDGTMTCTYVGLSEDDLWEMAHKMVAWKSDNRTAYTEMKMYEVCDGDEKEIRYVARAENDRQLLENADRMIVSTMHRHEGAGDLSRIAYKKNAWPIHKTKSVWLKQNKHRQDGRSHQKNSLIREGSDVDSLGCVGDIDLDCGIGSEGDSEAISCPPVGSKDMKPKAYKGRKYFGLPDAPTSEFGAKEEKIVNPVAYAQRNGLYELNIREKSLHYSKWKKFGGFMAIGDGKVYNGYFVLERRDFYTDYEGEPVRVIDIWEGSPFPKWHQYYYWYHNCIWNFMKNPGYDSDGNTVPGAYDSIGSDWLASSSEDDMDGLQPWEGVNNGDFSSTSGSDSYSDKKYDLQANANDGDDSREMSGGAKMSDEGVDPPDEEVNGNEEDNSSDEEVNDRRCVKRRRVILDDDSD